jgi:hypothetical protein
LPRPSEILQLCASGEMFWFFAQNQPAIGPVVIYVFDFEDGRDGRYRPGLKLT